MASPERRLSENARGELFVDDTCIDCATCRHIAPRVFGRAARGLSYVREQPAAGEATERALMALVACPTASIGTLSRLDVSGAAARFPEPIRDDVYYCGYTSPRSFGASSYLIRRAHGNVLVDSPRASRPLIERIRQLGGASLMFLTHRDDVADHAAYARRLGCQRVIHEADVTGSTRGVERTLAGEDPVRLEEDLVAIPVPGHTPGSAALLYRDEVLFSGDHLWGRDGALHASRAVCWHSWSEQTRSLERLLAFPFREVFPGHGARFRTASAADMHDALERLLRRLRRAS